MDTWNSDLERECWRRVWAHVCSVARKIRSGCWTCCCRRTLLRTRPWRSSAASRRGSISGWAHWLVVVPCSESPSSDAESSPEESEDELKFTCFLGLLGLSRCCGSGRWCHPGQSSAGTMIRLLKTSNFSTWFTKKTQALHYEWVRSWSCIMKGQDRSIIHGMYIYYDSQLCPSPPHNKDTGDASCSLFTLGHYIGNLLSDALAWKFLMQEPWLGAIRNALSPFISNVQGSNTGTLFSFIKNC